MRDLYALYNKYNQEIFNGQLPAISLKYNGRIKRCMGYYNSGRKEIDISKVFLTDKYIPSALDDTLIHEMIHAWQDLVLHIPGDHRKTFHQMARYANTFGHQIATKFDPRLYLNTASTLNAHPTNSAQYFCMSYGKRTSSIRPIDIKKINKFSKTKRYYKVPASAVLPTGSSFKDWKQFLEHKCIPVERSGHQIVRVDSTLYLLSDFFGGIR